MRTPSPSKNPLAARLLRLREKAGLTQTSLGEIARIKQGDISKYEKKRIPSVPVLLRLAVALDATVESLVRGLYPPYDQRYPEVPGTPIAPEAMARAWAIDPALLEALRDAQTARAVQAFLQLDADTRDWVMSAPELRGHGDAPDRESNLDQRQAEGASRAKRQRR